MNPTTSTTGSTPASGENKPIASFRFGNVSAAIFPVRVKDGTVMDVSIRRSYKDADGAWKHTHSLAQEDLLPAALALTKCYEHIALLRKDRA
jgi:hypothetical protein